MDNLRRNAYLLIAMSIFIACVAVWYVWTHVFDTLANRARVSDRALKLVEAALANPQDRRYADELVHRARSEYSFEAVAATVGLGAIGDAASPIVVDLSNLMDSPDPTVRREAANSLDKLGVRSTPVMEKIATEAFEPPITDKSLFAVMALGKIGKPAVKYLPELRSRLGTGGVLFDDALHSAIEKLEAFELDQKNADEETDRTSNEPAQQVK